MITRIEKPINKDNINHVAAALIDKQEFRSRGKIYLIVSDLRKKTVRYIADDLTVRSAQKSTFKILNKKYIKEEVEKFNRRFK